MHSNNILVFLFLTFTSLVDGYDRNLFQLSLEILDLHSDAVFISKDFPTSIPDKLYQRLQISQTLNNDNAFTPFSKTPSNIIISNDNLSEMLQILQKLIILGESEKFKIFILYPNQVANKSSIDQILSNGLSNQSTLQNISFAHNVFLGFRNLEVPTTPRRNRKYNQISKGYTFYELYVVNSQFTYNEVQEFSMLNCGMCDSRNRRRKNLHGTLLKLEGVQDAEYNDDTLFYEQNNTLYLNTSFSMKILQLLQQSLNFTTEFHRSNQWGAILPNGTWFGVVKDVYDGAIDIGITTTVMLPSRASQIRFLPAVDENILTAFFRPPSLNEIRDIFMQPFKKDLWAAVFTTWLALAVSIILFTHVRRRIGATAIYNTKAEISAGQPSEPDLSGDSFILILATATQQGWDEHPTSLSLRTIFISASFTGVIAYAGYSAAIVSTLSLRIDPIKNPQELLASNLRLGLRAGFINDLLQKHETRDIINALYSRLSPLDSERLANITSGIQLLQTASYAFVSTKENVYDIMKTTLQGSDICGIKEMSILKQGFKAGMFTARNFPYHDLFRGIIILIRERGILWRIRNDFTYTRRCLEASADNSGRALGPNDVFTAFMILVGGYILSLSFLLVEKTWCLKSFVYIQ